MCHTPEPNRGSKNEKYILKVSIDFFLFGKSNYRRSLFSFLFHRIKIFNHTKISTLQVRAL